MASAGDWDYVGVHRLRTAEYDDVPAVFQLEARRPLGRSTTRYVRLLVDFGWDFDHPDEPYPLHIGVGGVDPDNTRAHIVIPADSALLRSVPLRRLFGQATAELVQRHGKVSPKSQRDAVELPDFRQLRTEWPKGDTRTVAKWAGYLYAQAVADGQPATKAVEDAFGVSKTTARRMVAMARELEFLADNVVGAPVPSRN